MAQPRVLLVEDDSMLRQFVRMALEDLDIELLEAANVPAALAALSEAPAALVLTDLMMPGESGLDLLGHLHSQPALRGSARIVVLSAGVSDEMRVRLQAFDIWRVLLKPVPVAQLLQCVKEALQSAARPGNDAILPETAGAAMPLTQQQLEALVTYFGGDRRLFEAYMASCLAQFPHDVEAGDQAIRREDLQALRLLAHSLKTVLRTLGAPAADIALSLESACHAGLMDQAMRQWSVLRGQLRAEEPPQP